MEKDLDIIIKNNNEIYINDSFYDDLSQIIVMNENNAENNKMHTYCVCKECRRKISKKNIKKEYLASVMSG